MHWTPELVAAELERAAVTLRRLPPAIRKQRLTAWPVVVHSRQEAYGWESAAYKEPPPTAADITALDRVLLWLRAVDEVERRILWGYALHIRREKLARMIGKSRRTIWTYWMSGLMRIAATQNLSSSQTARKSV